MLVNIFEEWSLYAKHSKHINRCYSELKEQVEQARLQRGFCSFIHGVKNTRIIHDKNYRAQQFYKQNMFLKVKSAWLDRVIENRVETQKVVKLRNMRKRKLLTKCWEYMLNKTEDKRLKLRHVRKVTKTPIMIEYRLAIQKWQNFVVYERDLQKTIEEGAEYFKQKRLSYAYNTLLENHYITVERKEREARIDQYYFNKQALKIFDMFKVFLGKLANN